MNKADLIRIQIANTDKDLSDLQRELNRLETDCKHIWSTPIADHIYHEGYNDQGDPEGTMGVDRRLPCYIPARTDKRWKRVCSECGKIEYTSRVNEHITETPKF